MQEKFARMNLSAVSVIAALVAVTMLSACSGVVRPGPAAAGSTGLSDEQHANNAMSGCMQFASQDYCRQHIWGK